MDSEKVALFKTYLVEVDSEALDARLFDDNLSFIGYKESFVYWVRTVANTVQEFTPDTTNSGAFSAAAIALDCLQFPTDGKFDVLISSLKDALEKAAMFHSLMTIENLGSYSDACATIGADPEKTLAEFCRQFLSSVDSATKPNTKIVITLQIHSL